MRQTRREIRLLNYLKKLGAHRMTIKTVRNSPRRYAAVCPSCDFRLAHGDISKDGHYSGLIKHGLDTLPLP